MPTVTIIQRVLPHYRVPFFSGLAERLAHNGVKLKLVYGQEHPGTVPKSTIIHTSWSHQINNVYLKFPFLELVWQPCIEYLAGSDLVIVEQANRLLLNHVLLSRRKNLDYKLAYWGHGRNMQAGESNGLRGRIKRRLTVKVDWWFAYTKLSSDTVAAAGFPRERITVVQNAVSTREIDEQVVAMTPAQMGVLQKQIGIRSENVGVYCGGMYEDKKLGFLIGACEAIRSMVPDFELILIGEGPEQHIVEAAAHRHSWVHYVGPKYGADRVAYLLLARALLMPGLVGLAVVDSFAARVPLFTTDIPIHSPEIAYLENGINGVITAPSIEAYATTVAEYLRSKDQIQALRRGCATSAKKYTVENMIENFSEGVMRCLAA